MTIISEIWKPVSGNQNYEVSNLGRVRASKTRRGVTAGKILRPRPSGYGYFKVALRSNGRQKQFGIHRLVAKAFVGPCPTVGFEVNHKNSDSGDNRANNLEWVSHSDNMRHAFVNGRIRIPTTGGGELVGTHKLTNDKVREIRRRSSLGEKPLCLAKEFGVSRSNIRFICKRLTWKCVR